MATLEIAKSHGKKLVSLVLLSTPSSSNAQVPDATVIGPIETEPHPSLNSIYSASAIELSGHGYLEEEYFIEGNANRHTNPEMENAEVIDGGHRYRTRLIVRRPESAEDFNGVVVVEWWRTIRDAEASSVGR